jgi:hypothetical protein
MGVMSDLDFQLRQINQVLREDVEPGTPEQLIEERVHRF